MSSSDFSADIRGNPYLGTYNTKPTVVQAPDAMIYVNEEYAIPFCLECDSKVPVKQYVTSISTSLDTDGAGGGNASLEMVVPRSANVSFIRDGQSVLTNMMEVEIWFKGAYTVHGFPRYYRAFWGYINNISENYSDGNHTLSINCSDMLSFWNIIKFNLHPSLLSDRISGRNNQQAWATRFQRSNPFQILAALSTVSRVDLIEVQSFQNANLVSEDAREVWRESADQLIKYWGARMNKIARAIRVYGVAGDSIFNSAAFYAGDRDTQAQIAAELNNVSSQRLFGVDLAVNESHFSPFLTIGNIDNFQSEHRGRLDIMVQVKDHIGWEFFMDTTGEIVFKPPFFNIDARQNFPVSWIRDIDVLNWNFEESEPEATRVDVVGQLNSMFDSGMSAEVQPNGCFQDFHLCRQYGVRQENIQAHWLKTGEACGFYAVDKVAQYAANRFTGSITIPGRPELRLGLPVYVESRDCFYYVHSISHSFAFGSSFTTTLGLRARRTRFSSTDLLFKNGTQAPNGEMVRVDNNGVNRDTDGRNVGLPNVIMRPASVEEFNAKSSLDDPFSIGVPDAEGVPHKVARVGGYVDVSDNKLQLQKGWDQMRRGITWDISGGLWVYDFDDDQTAMHVHWCPEDTVSPDLRQDVSNALIPVSDSSGYELVGAFPYGRGLIIDEVGDIAAASGNTDEDGQADGSTDAAAAARANAAVLLRQMTPDDQTEVTEGTQTRSTAGGGVMTGAGVMKIDQTDVGQLFASMSPDDESSNVCGCQDNYTIDNVLTLQNLGSTLNDVFERVSDIDSLLDDSYQVSDSEIWDYEAEKSRAQEGDGGSSTPFGQFASHTLGNLLSRQAGPISPSVPAAERSTGNGSPTTTVQVPANPTSAIIRDILGEDS